ncbi:MAG TPA: histidinol dehydrogenase [Papillibacter sp.]|jgi:histidinol dehydrogenase|nr:histidinol dehydrogenase [Papillibacter sp.]
MIDIIKAIKARDIFVRQEDEADIAAAVAAIIDDVRQEGDAAVLRYCEKFDGARLDALELTSEEVSAALKQVDGEFVEILLRAAKNIEAFHRRQIREGFEFTGENGEILGQKVLPLSRVGVYIPGGTAAYPSTVLMSCIPARLAGVREIVLVTPPRADGTVRPEVVAAARIAGANRIFKCGGAQAIAALAYGTESIPAVDKIVGPGNAYVAEAKRQVFGRVAIDMIAGPSEILVIADEAAQPRHIAADLLSQAEHDVRARAVLVTPSETLAHQVAAEIEVQLNELPREAIARASIESGGKIILVDCLEEAVELSNTLAPEHLELCVDDPFPLLEKVRNAGSVFLGKYCPEALGDYYAGPNHTLPTLGTARFSSPLSVDDFIKKFSYTYYTKEALHRVKDDVAAFAEREGLTAHARSVTIRFEPEVTK